MTQQEEPQPQQTTTVEIVALQKLAFQEVSLVFVCFFHWSEGHEPSAVLVSKVTVLYSIEPYCYHHSKTSTATALHSIQFHSIPFNTIQVDTFTMTNEFLNAAPSTISLTKSDHRIPAESHRDLAFPIPQLSSNHAQQQHQQQQPIHNNNTQRTTGTSNIKFPAGEEIDRMVAKAMLELSPQDRERALEELHGVVEVDDEDPSFIASCLDDLDNCLATMKQNTAYEEAERLSYSYVSNNRFRIMFLRSVRYVPQDAAERMIHFFEYKRELFGRDKLVTDLTLDDLHPEDRPIMEGGYIQVSPQQDQVGRPILFFFEKVKQQYARRAENAVRLVGNLLLYYYYRYYLSPLQYPYRFDPNSTPTCPFWRNPKRHKRRVLSLLCTMSIAKETPIPTGHGYENHCHSNLEAFTFA